MAVGGRFGLARQRLEETIGVRKCPMEGIHNFLAHVVAAGPDRWSQRHDQLLRISSKIAPQIPHGFLDHPCQRTPPTGMDRRHHTPLRVHHEHRQAVSYADCQEDSRLRSHQPVASRRVGGRRH
jgi:hypothetical protein